MQDPVASSIAAPCKEGPTHREPGMNVVDPLRRKLMVWSGGLLLSLGTAAVRGAEPAARATLVFTIDVKWLNATAYRVEREITSKIERAVRTLPDLLDMHSTASVGRGQVQLSFDAQVDAVATATAIRNRIDQIKTTLPREAGPPLIGWHRETGKSQ
jgi:hypothetical protein